MKIIEQIQNLEIFANRLTNNPKSLHRRERQKAFIFLCNWFSQIYLDLFQYRGGKIDFNTDPLYLKLTSISESFYKLMR
jgi:hypothetical protein